jgi:hypothetical protein
MAHIRRKYYDLIEAHRSPIAIEAVERVAGHPIKHIEELLPWNVATNLPKNLRLAA